MRKNFEKNSPRRDDDSEFDKQTIRKNERLKKQYRKEAKQKELSRKGL